MTNLVKLSSAKAYASVSQLYKVRGEPVSRKALKFWRLIQLFTLYLIFFGSTCWTLRVHLWFSEKCLGTTELFTTVVHGIFKEVSNVTSKNPTNTDNKVGQNSLNTERKWMNSGHSKSGCLIPGYIPTPGKPDAGLFNCLHYSPASKASREIHWNPT